MDIQKPTKANDDTKVGNNKEALSSMIIEIPVHSSSINQHNSDYQIREGSRARGASDLSKALVKEKEQLHEQDSDSEEPY